MSVLRRPDGNDVAATFGEYMSEAEVKNSSPGDKFDVLCEGGIHYEAKIVEIDAQFRGRLHFCKWNDKYDQFGSFLDMYLAPVGKYSAGTLNGANQFIDPNDTSSRRNRKYPANDGGDKDDGVPSYAEKSRYDDSYLYKPYRNDRKRRYVEEDAYAPAAGGHVLLQASTMVHGSSDPAVKTNYPPTKKPSTVGAVQDENGAAADEGTSLEAPEAAEVPAPAYTFTETQADPLALATAVEPVGSVADQDPVAPEASTIANAAPQVTDGADRAPPLALAPVPTPTAATTAAPTAPRSYGRQLEPSHRWNWQQQAAPSPIVAGGGRTFIRWRHHYQEMLRASGAKRCQDAAAAMGWLDAHLEPLRARNTIKGKVYGPIGLLCTTSGSDVAGAMMLEHSIGTDILLGFLVDRLLDQAYLHEELVVKQGLQVQVLFSGTRDRFDGYKALPSQLQHRDLPGGACELVNLADRLLCGQLIRNLLHSEGCTAQTRLSGDLLGSAEPAAALSHLYRFGCQPPPVLYLARDAEIAAPTAVRRYYLKEVSASDLNADSAPSKYYTPEHFAEEVIEASAFGAGEYPRLLYCHQEQTQYAESVPAHIGAAPIVPSYSAPRHSHHAPSSSSAHAAPSNRTGYGYMPPIANGNRSQPLPAQPTRPPMCSFAPLDQFQSLRSAAWAGLRTHAGSLAVWDLLGMRAGVWFPDAKAMEADLEETDQPRETALLPSTNPNLPAMDAVGFFLPLSDFQSIREEGSSAPKRVPTYFGATWPLQLLQLPPRPTASGEPGTAEAEADVAPAAAEPNLSTEEPKAPACEGQQPRATSVPGDAVASDNEDDVASCPEDMDVDDREDGKAEPEADQTATPQVVPPEPAPLASEETQLMQVDQESEGAEDSFPAQVGAEEKENRHAEDPDAQAANTAEGGASSAQTSNLEHREGGASTEMSTQAELSRPCLALHRKSGTLGLAFLSKQAFLVWYGQESQEGLEDIFADVSNERLIFISLANASVPREFYNMRKLKSKHVSLFSAQQPSLAEVVAAVLREIAPPSASAALVGSSPAPLPLSMLLGGQWGSSGALEPMALGGTYLTEQRTQWSGSAALLNGRPTGSGVGGSGSGGSGVSASGIGAFGVGMPSVKQFKSQLAFDTTIVNLQRSLNHLDYYAAELARSSIDVESLRKLLCAQLQLARATRLMLK